MLVLWKRLYHVLALVEDWARVITIVSMTLIVFYQVVARVLFKWSSPALEESARFIMIWSIFIGAVVTTRQNGHIKMGGYFSGAESKLWFELISNILVVFFLFIFAWWSFEYAQYSIHKKMNSIVLGIPLIAVHACFPVTGILMALHSIINLGRHVKWMTSYFHKERK